MIDYQISEHDRTLMKIAAEANTSTGLDGVPEVASLRSALAVEEYAIERTLASVIAGLEKRGIEIDQKVLLGAYVDGQQIVPSNGFYMPLNKGKTYEI